MIDSVAEDRVDARAEGKCPVCGGKALEPRSGTKWQCVSCARQLGIGEVVLE